MNFLLFWNQERWSVTYQLIHLSSTGNNLAKSQSIFKKLERFGIEFKFPKIWDQPQLSSLIRSEVVIKNVRFSRFWNHQKMLKASRKQTSTSGGYNSIKSSSISKKYMRYRKEISFPVIWEQPERSSLFRSRVMSKRINFSLIAKHFPTTLSKSRGYGWRKLKFIPILFL